MKFDFLPILFLLDEVSNNTRLYQAYHLIFHHGLYSQDQLQPAAV